MNVDNIKAEVVYEELFKEFEVPKNNNFGIKGLDVENKEDYWKKHMVVCKDCIYLNKKRKICMKFEPFFKKDNHLHVASYGFCAFGRKEVEEHI